MWSSLRHMRAYVAHAWLMSTNVSFRLKELHVCCSCGKWRYAWIFDSIMTTSLCHESFCVYIRKENFLNERRGYSIKDTGILEKKRTPTARTYDLPIISSDSFRARFGKLFFEVQDVIFFAGFWKENRIRKNQGKKSKVSEQHLTWTRGGLFSSTSE